MKTGHQYSEELVLVVGIIYHRPLLYNFVCSREAEYSRARSL
jgi:hypothetical protein